ncbi:hypothetical protein RugamoR57_03670 [Duganella caerulea]
MSQLNAVRTPLGLAKVDSFLTHIAEPPDLSVTLFPSWFAPAVPDWPRQSIEGDFQLFEAATQHGFSAELSAFLAAGGGNPSYSLRAPGISMQRSSLPAPSRRLTDSGVELSF